MRDCGGGKCRKSREFVDFVSSRTQQNDHEQAAGLDHEHEA